MSRKSKQAKPVGTAPARKPRPSRKKPKFARSPSNPYRAGTGYATLYDILWRHREKGVGRRQLLEHYMAASGKSERLAGYDITVVVSVRKCGKGHKSAKRFAYWIERQNSHYRLHEA